jgi:hypothetical protein
VRLLVLAAKIEKNQQGKRQKLFSEQRLHSTLPFRERIVKTAMEELLRFATSMCAERNGAIFPILRLAQSALKYTGRSVRVLFNLGHILVVPHK